MVAGDMHEPTIPRRGRDAGHWRASLASIVIGVVALVAGVLVFALVPMSDMSYLGGGLLVGGAIVFLYIGYDQRKMAYKMSQVEDVLERADAILAKSGK